MNLPAIDYSYELLVPPAAEPITLNQAKAALRIPLFITENDDTVLQAVAAARDHLESAYGIKIMPQKWRLTFGQFPRADRFRLPWGPIQSVDGFRYHSSDGSTTTMVEGVGYSTRIKRKPGAEIVLPYGAVWPGNTLRTNDAIELDVTAGWLLGGSPELLPIPPKVIQALTMLTEHFDKNRGAVTMGTLMKAEPLALGVSAMMASLGFGYGS